MRGPGEPEETGSHRLPRPGGSDRTQELPTSGTPRPSTQHLPRQEHDEREDLARQGTTLGPYRLVEEIGAGGMGVVHRAIGPDGDEVAIKVLRAHVAYDSNARDRLRREVETLSRVRSEGVAAVLDADIDGEHPYLVTQFVPGPPLDDIVDEEGPLEPRRLAALGRGLAAAIQAIHRVGVVHRDIKPGNVLMVDDHPVLIDFGIAHVADESRLTQTGLVMGTPGYLSPEIVNGAEVSPATDWWGWAATLAFAASGRSPFGSGPMPAILDRVARGQADLRGVDPRIRPLLAAALSPDPKYRPSYDDVLAELDVFAKGGSTGTIVQAPPPGVVHPRRQQTSVHQHRAPATEQFARGRGPGPQYVGGPHRHPPQQAPARPMDPRIGQPDRSWTLLLLALATSGVALFVPVLAWAAAFAWVFAARWCDRSITANVLRQYASGRRRSSDRAVSIALSPWHAVTAAFSTLLVVIIPVFLGMVTGVSVAIAMSVLDFTAPRYDRPVAMGAATLVALWAVWWGPGGTATRRGSRTLVRALSPNRQFTVGLVVLLAAVAALCVLFTAGRIDEAVSWWPYSDVSYVPGNGLIPAIPADW